jgi:hypothetical protein
VFETMSNDDVVQYFSQRLNVPGRAVSTVTEADRASEMQYSTRSSRIGSGRVFETCAALLQEALDRGRAMEYFVI